VLRSSASGEFSAHCSIYIWVTWLSRFIFNLHEDQHCQIVAQFL
jgi:hypothetical protein